MTDQVAPDVKSGRVRALAEVESRLRQRYFSSLLGRQLEVLVESAASSPPGLVGTACRYAPVSLMGGTDLVGQLVGLTAGSVVDGMIQAQSSS